MNETCVMIVLQQTINISIHRKGASCLDLCVRILKVHCSASESKNDVKENQ